APAGSASRAARNAASLSGEVAASMLRAMLKALRLRRASSPRRRSAAPLRRSWPSRPKTTIAPLRRVATGVAPRAALAQGVEIRRDVARVLLGQTRVGHDVAGHDALRVAQPVQQVAGLVGQHAGDGD